MNQGASTALLWLRRALRMEDNPALEDAVGRHARVLPVYVLDDSDATTLDGGGASRWWLHHSLEAFGRDLEKHGSRLLLLKGDPANVLPALLRETGARALCFDRVHEPEALRQEERLAEALGEASVELRPSTTNLLWDPGTVLNKSGQPYKVFTPFWKACLAHAEPAAPIPAPSSLRISEQGPDSLRLKDLGLEPELAWADGFSPVWTPGRGGALDQLETFLEVLQRYPEDRDRPDIRGTSMLSPHLHFGEISPREIWQAVQEHGAHSTKRGMLKGTESFLRQLAWREFAHHLLHHFPHTADQPLRPEFAHYPWQANPAWLKRWQEGRTGYPIVDAGMRELWTTGWMHNRVRMITASFLVKDLRIPWQDGANWFMDTLVDADLANNSLGWQWVAGSGADAAPYFRIFNPVTQGEKFDPDGRYIRTWVPELEALPNRWIHKPWKAPKELSEKIGRAYPEPIVDHAEARDRALEGYNDMLEWKNS